MGKKLPSVNLVKTGQNLFLERFINWALTIGRAVVILTELVALMAFLYRFSLDRELIDLHAKIKQEQAIVAYLKDSEETYRNLQDRLLLISNSSKEANQKLKTFNDIIALTPSGISFSEFSLNQNRIKISADAESVMALSALVEKLKKYPNIETVSLDKIENRPSNGIIKVAITIGFKEKKQYANK